MRRNAARQRREPELAPQNGMRGCAGKRQYNGFKDADHVARNVRRHADGDVHPYRCLVCRRWHIGSDNG